MKTQTLTESHVYILFKEIKGKKYFKIGKADKIDIRINQLNKTWGLFNEHSVSIHIKNDFFNRKKGVGIYFETIILKSLFILGYKRMNESHLSNNDGYTEFFEYKEDSTEDIIISQVLALFSPYEITTTFTKAPIRQQALNKEAKSVNISSLIPQQISLFHIEYFFKLLEEDKIKQWKTELLSITSSELEWKKANNISPKSPKKSDIDYSEYLLVSEFNSILSKIDNSKIEKSHNKNTIGYIQTFVKNILKVFNKTIDNIDFNAFMLLLNKIFNSNKFNSLYEDFETNPAVTASTVARRKLNIIQWIELQFKHFQYSFSI